MDGEVKVTVMIQTSRKLRVKAKMRGTLRTTLTNTKTKRKMKPKMKGKQRAKEVIVVKANGRVWVVRVESEVAVPVAVALIAYLMDQ